MALMLRVRWDSDESVYKQIARQIRHGIGSGELKPGSSLPPVRALASDLGLNLNTVARAYRLLEEEGFVTIESRRGVRINPPAGKTDDGRLARLCSDLRALLHRLRQVGLRPEEIRRLVADETDRQADSSHMKPLS